MQELFNGLRYVIRYGIAWRAMPNDLPPWHAVHQQAHRWLAAGCFEALAQDLRAMLPSSGPSPGRHAAGVSSRTTSDIPKPSQASTSSHSSDTYSKTSQH
jgi:transposase